MPERSRETQSHGETLSRHEAEIASLTQSMKSLGQSVREIATTVDNLGLTLGNKIAQTHSELSRDIRELAKPNWTAVGVIAGVAVPMILSMAAFAWYPITLANSHNEDAIRHLVQADIESAADRRELDRRLSRIEVLEGLGRERSDKQPVPTAGGR